MTRCAPWFETKLLQPESKQHTPDIERHLLGEDASSRALFGNYVEVV